MSEPGRCINTLQVAELTGIKPATLRQWRSRSKNGEPIGPPSFRARGVVLYRLAAVEQWLADCEAAEARSA